MPIQFISRFSVQFENKSGFIETIRFFSAFFQKTQYPLSENEQW